MARSTTALALSLAALAACSPTPFRPAQAPTAESASPLGPSYVLLPLPTEDDGLLGRVLPELPRPGRSLEETSRPNPCAAALTARKPSPLASTFEDAQEISAQAQAKAMLGAFGFESDASRASHFFYKIETQKRVALTDTTEYVACCKEKGCGVGFVSALVYGDGEYATGEETSAGAGVNVAAAAGGGSISLKVLHRRKVHGFLAALVTLTSSEKEAALGPLGVAASEPTIPERVQVAYARDKVSLVELPEGKWMLATGMEALTENEFVRRYEAVTGSTELRAAETRKNNATVVTLGAITAASLFGVYWGATNLQRPCGTGDLSCWHSTPEFGTGTPAPPPGTTCIGDACGEYIDPNEKTTNVGGILALTLSGITALTVTPMFIISLFSKDGWPTDHSLSEDDARRYVTRYNRTMLRRAGERVDHQIRIENGARLELHPYLTPSGLGFGGTF